LTRLAEPGDPKLCGLVHEHGAAALLEAIRTDQLADPAAADWRSRLGTCDPHADLEHAQRLGARLVCPGDREWPPQLEALTFGELVNRRGGVPVALWALGPLDVRQASARSVAVVGSRAASSYGEHVAGDFGAELASRGVSVVSGAAYGIDAAAHRGALAVGGTTLAVLACGVDLTYPLGHAALLRRVAAEGVVLSELPPGCSPSRLRFLSRNRLIAALSAGTVVVEAALRSGALNTVSWAQSIMRATMGVPGPVTSPVSAGVHQLLRSGKATVVTDADEVIEEISASGEGLAPAKTGEVRSRDRLGERLQRVLEAVPVTRADGVATIATAAGMPVEPVLAALGELSLDGFVERSGSGWRLSARERSAARAPR
jgi:DNA processing protein